MLGLLIKLYIIVTIIVIIIVTVMVIIISSLHASRHTRPHILYMYVNIKVDLSNKAFFDQFFAGICYKKFKG